MQQFTFILHLITDTFNGLSLSESRFFFYFCVVDYYNDDDEDGDFANKKY